MTKGKAIDWNKRPSSQNQETFLLCYICVFCTSSEKHCTGTVTANTKTYCVKRKYATNVGRIEGTGYRLHATKKTNRLQPHRTPKSQCLKLTL